MTNNMYTHEERSVIVKYLVDHNVDSNLQGNALWKRMEQEGVLNRTWQSMRSHFKNTIINMLHMYGLSEYHRRMIIHAFGRRTRPNTSHTARPAPPKKPVPFSSDSDSDTTICVASQPKRPRRDSSSSSSLDLLICDANNDRKNSHVGATAVDTNQPSTSTPNANTNCDIRSYMASTASTDNNKPSTSTSVAKPHKIRRQKHNTAVVIIDSDDDETIKTEVKEQQIVDTRADEPFSLEEDTKLIMFFKTHNCYLADIQNNFAYVAFNYDTPTSIRTPKELRSRFVEHIMPKLYTYDCLTYEEMVTYYDRADIDVPVELQQIISKTVAEQKKNKQITVKKLTVDVSTQAEQQQRSSLDNIPKIEVKDIDLPKLHDACPEANVTGKPTMVDASTQVQQQARVDKVCNTECQCQVDASTQTQPHGDKLCSTDAIVQHVQFMTNNTLHILLPDHDDRRPLQDLQNICGNYNNNNMSPKSAHMVRQQKKYSGPNDKRYVDVAVDSSARAVLIEKYEAELLRLTAEVKRLEQTLCKLRGYAANGTGVGNKQNRNTGTSCSLVVKNEHGARSNNTTIVPCTQESVGDGEAEVNKSVAATDSGSGSVPTDTTRGGSQTAAASQPELMFDIFHAELHQKHQSTQVDADQQLDTSNTTQDGGQEENSPIISIQPDIEFCSPMMPVAQPSDDSDDSEVSRGTRGCQLAPLNLSTHSHESETNETVVLSTSNTEKFYSAVSQSNSQN